MQQIFVPESAVSGDGLVSITGEDARHLGRVLRMRPGERIRVVTGDDRGFTARLESFSEGEILARLEGAVQDTELSLSVSLYVGLPKGDRMDTIVEKTVELGVARIVPVVMQRTVLRLDSAKKESRRNRWQAIAESAARQSKRSRIPEVAPVMSFDEALSEEKTLDLLLVPYEGEKGMEGTRRALSLLDPGKTVGILVGPEGGFSEEEAAAAAACGQVISLGGRILRTDTASITCTAMVMLAAELGRIG